MDMTKISIVTAVRNGAATLESTMMSIRSQSYSDIEHVLVDGGSSDGTVEIIESFGVPKSRWISERDSGVYEAFNKGLAMSSGDVVGFLNCGDTYWHQRVIEEI